VISTEINRIYWRKKRYESNLIRPEIENQSKWYAIDPKIKMW